MIEGDVMVEEPPDMAERTVDPTDGAVGAYVWRARGPNINNGRSKLGSGLEGGNSALPAPIGRSASIRCGSASAMIAIGWQS